MTLKRTRKKPLRSFAEAKAIRALLEADSRRKSDRLKAYPRNALGLTADEHKTAEWRRDRAASDEAFRRLQRFNEEFVQDYGPELAAERRERFQVRP